ncbi:MAG: response regulator [bacterium]
MTTTAEPRAGRRARILVVDDEAQTVKAVQYLLRRRYEVLGATRAEEALELTHTPSTSCSVISACPGMTGDQFFTRIAEEYADTVRILITAYADMDALVRSVNRGRIFAYLPKPWRVEGSRAGGRRPSIARSARCVAPGWIACASSTSAWSGPTRICAASLIWSPTI